MSKMMSKKIVSMLIGLFAMGLIVGCSGANSEIVENLSSPFVEEIQSEKLEESEEILSEIVEESEEAEVIEEGCLSVPGIHENVRRPKSVHVTYLDENLQPHDEWIEGFAARVFQHEYDHLEGKLFVDHLSTLRKQMIKKKLLAMSKGKINCAYKVKQNV